MEELIWKYLDGESTADEKIQIDQLMAQDAEFKLMYDKLVIINHSLMMNAPTVMSSSLKNKLQVQIDNQVKLTKVIHRPIISKAWLIGLVFLGISGILIPQFFPTENNFIPNWKIPFNDITMQYIIWVLTGFWSLFLIDYLIFKPSASRKQVYSLV